MLESKKIALYPALSADSNSMAGTADEDYHLGPVRKARLDATRRRFRTLLRNLWRKVLENQRNFVSKECCKIWRKSIMSGKLIFAVSIVFLLGPICAGLADFIAVDDFESYNDSNNVIYDTWYNSHIMIIGPDPFWLATAPEPVHTGDQSMGFFYENSNDWWSGHYYSEIYREFPVAQDWNEQGMKVLRLYFYGTAGNAAGDTEQMYVALEDNTTYIAAVDYDGDANDVQIEEWQQWDMALSEFTDVDANSIKKIYIGFGDHFTQPIPGGDGIVYFDDIRLYPPMCINASPADLNCDCIVNYKDLRIMANEWLHTTDLTADLYVDVDNIVNLLDYAVLANQWMDQQALWPP